MKTLKLFVSLALTVFCTSVFAQSVIMDENFQSFKDQGWNNDTTSLCDKKNPNSKSNFKVSKTYGDTKVEFAFIKAAVSPTCGSKKTPSKVSDGFVKVRKDGGSLTVSQLPYISTIEVGASATGDERGYALFKSVDGGEWVKIGEYIGAKSEGADAQYGFINKITVNESNVALKFLPTLGGKSEDGPALQTFCIHSIKVFGK
ncbi:MAG: hypothetical protein LBR81_09295 [Prevotellaceae bacterium]|jgi:hypothetical protein|nr:hypothetical protein [Prevotellaceae bacterium]